LRRLAELPLLNKENSARATAFEVVIRRAAEDNFTSFGYQKPKRMKSKKDKHWVSWKGKIVLKLTAPKVLSRVRIPDTQPDRLGEFMKWFYDNSTGEAIIRLAGEDRPEIRLFDPMEVFSFSDEDLKFLCENQIKHGAGDDTENEANLFMRVANKARGIRAELREVNERIRKTDELNMDIDDLSKQLDQSIVKRFEKPAEAEVIEHGEKHTDKAQEEVIVIDVPEATTVTDNQFADSLLNLSDSHTAGSEDATNPQAGAESRAGAIKENP